MSLPVEEVGTERLSARVTMPLTTASLSARPTRATAPLVLKPPSLGRYIYWDSRSSGHKLDYRKRNKTVPSGFDYLYLGYWSPADILAILTELSADDALRVFRTEANRTAKLYLQRKKERENV